MFFNDHGGKIMNLEIIRELFPLTKNYVFLNNAAESPLNLNVKKSIDEYLNICLESPQLKPTIRNNIRERLSELFGGQPDEYALMTSTGMGISMVAAGFKWSEGDNVVVPSNEHWNNTFPWQELKRRGVDLRFVGVDKDNRINPKDIEAIIDKNTKIVAIAAVSFNTGFRTNLKKIADIAHAKDALFVVDGIQGLGVVPINVEKDHIDVLCSAGFKWLLGIPGTGFMYVNKSSQKYIHPVSPGMFAADLTSNQLIYHPDARRYETGSLPYSLFYGWTAGLKLLKDIGVENIYERILHLTDRIIFNLKKKNIQILSPIENVLNRSAILVFTLGSMEANKALYKKLIEKNIIVTLRDGFIRVSPSFYNTEEEIDYFLTLI